MTPLAILESCCGEGQSRYTRTTPFADGDFICATNGRIAVRFPRASVEGFRSPDDDLEPVNMSSLPWNAELYDQTATLIPAFDRPTAITCGRCDGLGELRCNLDHMHECVECGGRGTTHPTRIIPIPAYAGYIYLRDTELQKMVDAGAVMYLRNDAVKRTARFTIKGGGEALLCVQEAPKAGDW